ncbi:hypothetical protein B0T17DRAFT_542717, partial [Bombardia bombarda]
MSGKYAFTKTLKEVRFLFCQTAEHSAATRSFLTRAYPIMKKNNPLTPIMLREAAGTSPRCMHDMVWTRSSLRRLLQL